MVSVAASRIERVATYRPLYQQHNFGSQQRHIIVLTSDSLQSQSGIFLFCGHKEAVEGEPRNRMIVIVVCNDFIESASTITLHLFKHKRVSGLVLVWYVSVLVLLPSYPAYLCLAHMYWQCQSAACYPLSTVGILTSHWPFISYPQSPNI